MEFQTEYLDRAVEKKKWKTGSDKNSVSITLWPCEDTRTMFLSRQGGELVPISDMPAK